MHSPKIKPIHGIILLFLLLAIPVGIYMYQTQDVGEMRSQAGAIKITDAMCAQGYGPMKPLACPSGQVPKAVTVLVPYTGNSVMHGSTVESKRCECKPATGVGGLSVAVSKTPTPTGTIGQRCNASCASDTTCGEGMVCTKINGVGKCRNSQCYGVEDCWCYAVGTPTPAVSCNTACATDVDCGTSMICVKTTAGNKCRNPQCYGVEDCLCYSTLTTPTPILPTPTEQDLYYPTPTPIRVYVPVAQQQELPTPTPTISSMLLSELLATPTPIMSQLPLVTAPILTIDPFYNSKKQAQPLFTLSGTSDPNTQLSISITPDGVGSTITADSLGYWTYTLPKKLTNGDKQLTVLARSPSGGQMTKTETFKVVGGFQFPTAAFVFSLILALGIGGYILYQKKMTKSPPPSQPYTPTTTPEFTPPEQTSTDEPSAPLSPESVQSPPPPSAEQI